MLVELTDGSGEIEVELEDHDDKTFTITLNSGMHCPYSTASDVDGKITALGSFAVYSETNCEDEKGICGLARRPRWRRPSVRPW